MSEPWLNEYPKDRQIRIVCGRLALVLMLLCAVFMITGGDAKGPHAGWLVAFLILGVYYVIWTVIWMSYLASYQICPHCHHRARSGFRVCAGCGYHPDAPQRIPRHGHHRDAA